MIEVASPSKSDPAPVIGMIHAGGVLADATVLKQAFGNIMTVFAPKVRSRLLIFLRSESSLAWQTCFRALLRYWESPCYHESLESARAFCHG